MTLVLPKLTKAKFFGYTPIFDSAIDVEVKNNLLILLGGNGLGKTTLLQSVIYALGGSLDSKIEPLTEKRWSKKYFVDRLNNYESAYVELEFKLRDDTLRIKRGFQSEKLLEFSVNGVETVKNKSDFDAAFETYLNSNFNYDSLTSFRFLIHKLCYLSENRENLVWDTDIQTRILMLIFSDSIAENRFRTQNDQLQKFDSKIRHIQVDINKIQEKLQQFKTKKKETPEENVTLKESKKEKEISDLKKTYLRIIDAKFDLQKNLRKLSNELSTLNSEIEDIQDKIIQNEQQFLYKQITSYESEEAKLAIHKLIHHKLCPACGSLSQELHSKAVNYLHNGACPLCGTTQDNDIKKMAPGLEAELSEKLLSKISLESNLLTVENKLHDLQDQENLIQYNINKYMLETPSVVFVKDYHRERSSKEELQKTLTSLKKQQTDFQISFDKLKAELEKDYSTFRRKNNERLEQLSKLYENYATEFLGIPCTLIPIDNTRDFLELKLFVPRFNDVTRNSPDTCSEAQRFFLDIAFRMALIEMVCTMSNTTATFICETPENALDITYRNNVAEMFRIFIKKKNTIVISSNIQPEGIADSLIYHINKEKRKNSLLNFLDFGKLSKVQENHRDTLKDIVKEILNQ